MENKILDFYIKILEKSLTKDISNKEKNIKLWNKIKNNNKLLKYSININNNTFYSNIIVENILRDKSLYNTVIYNELINNILKNKNLSRIKSYINSNKTLLLIILENDSLVLTKEQKIFIIYEAENSPNTSKYYKENLKSNNIHGIGILDIRYYILKNKNFSLQEKKNLFNFFYPDDELKMVIIEELEWLIIKELKIENIDYINLTNSQIIQDNKIKDLINLINYMKSTIPEKVILNYKNRD